MSGYVYVDDSGYPADDPKRVSNAGLSDLLRPRMHEPLETRPVRLMTVAELETRYGPTPLGELRRGGNGDPGDECKCGKCRS